MHQWKKLSINFVTSLLILIDLKGASYNFILVIIDWLAKMVHYKAVKIIINAPGLSKIIIDRVIYYQGFLVLIVINKCLFFVSKFGLLLYYFLCTKQKLFTIFYPQTDSKAEQENGTMEAYFQAFINFN